MSGMNTFNIRSACPACGSRDHKIICSIDYLSDPLRAYIVKYYKLENRISDAGYEERFSGAMFEPAVCQNCSLVYQKQVPGDDLLSEVYATWIPAGNPDRSISQHAHRHYVSEALRIASLLLRKTNKKYPSELHALDFGLGRGGFAMALLGVGMKTYGFDFAEDRQKEGARNGIRMISDREIDELSFDFINTEQVFEHLSEPAEVFGRLFKALKPNGVLKISVPFSKSLESNDYQLDWNAGPYARRSIMPIAPLEHLQYFKRPALNKLAERHGMSEVHLGVREEIDSFIDMSHPRRVFRQFAGLLARGKVRNYFLFQKR